MIARTVVTVVAASLLVAGLAAAPVAQDEGTGAPAAPRALPPALAVKPATPDDLDFRPGMMQIVTDEKSGGRFLVFTYSVVNTTGKTQRFSPRFDILMGDGTIHEAGRGVPVEAASRLRRACASAQALDQFQVMGEILDGEGNGREGFVVWPATGDAKAFTLFVSGTSAAFDRVDGADGKKSIVRRTWCRDYAVPGTADPRSSAEARFDPIRDRWIMR